MALCPEENTPLVLGNQNIGFSAIPGQYAANPAAKQTITQSQYNSINPYGIRDSDPFMQNIYRSGLQAASNVAPLPGAGGAPGYTAAGAGGAGTNNFNIPMNLFPYSTSSSSNSSSNKSNSASNSLSGINWQSDIAKGMLPLLLQQGQQLPGVVDKMGQTLQDQYANLMRRAMSPDAFQGTLNQLAGKGMLNSSIAQSTLSDAASQLARNVADKAYESQLAQYQTQLQVPGILGNLAQLGQQSTSNATATSSGSGGGSSSSYDANPLAPYQLMTQLMMAGL